MSNTQVASTNCSCSNDFTHLKLNPCRRLRKRDVSKLHVQLCAAIGLMLIAFVVGVDRSEVYGVCVAMSALIQYLTLVSVMWMGAEALFMFQKLVIIFVQITTKYIVTLSLVCWCELTKNYCMR